MLRCFHLYFLSPINFLCWTSCLCLAANALLTATILLIIDVNDFHCVKQCYFYFYFYFLTRLPFDVHILIFVLFFYTGEKKAWEVAQAPFKNLMMMGFMMWMAGSTVHLFSIGITFSALWQPISALQSVGKGVLIVFLFDH